VVALPTYEGDMVESTNSSFCTSVLDSGLVVVVVDVDVDDLGSSSLKGVHSNRPGRGSSFCGSKLYLIVNCFSSLLSNPDKNSSTSADDGGSNKRRRTCFNGLRTRLGLFFLTGI